uniref:uncharacterized protein n=1 Tax=Myxine glutinosa TaxID=7769 RepID=UPI00359022B0
MIRQMTNWMHCNDWMHCNTCFKQPEAGGRNFMLTSCGHILCHTCVQQFTEKCTSCGNDCKSMTICETMKPENFIFFHDPDETIKEQIKVILQVMEFQKNHRKNLFTYYRKHSNMERTCQELAENLQHYQRENLVLKKENAELKNTIKMAKGQQAPFGNRCGAPLNDYVVSRESLRCGALLNDDVVSRESLRCGAPLNDYVGSRESLRSATTGLRSNSYSPAEQPMMVSPIGQCLTSPYLLKRRFPSNTSEAMDCRPSQVVRPNNGPVFTPPLTPSGSHGALRFSGRTPPGNGKLSTPIFAGIRGAAGSTVHRNGGRHGAPACKGTPGTSASQYFRTSPLNIQDTFIQANKQKRATSSLSSDRNAAGTQAGRQIQVGFAKYF